MRRCFSKSCRERILVKQPKPPNDGVIDIEQDNSTTELGDVDHDRLSYSKGLPLETEQNPQTDSRHGGHQLYRSDARGIHFVANRGTASCVRNSR